MILAAFPVGGGPVVSWVLVPIALVGGVVFGIVLTALMAAGEDDR